MAASDLCSLDDVRLSLELPAGETERDTLIDDLIMSASEILMRWCGREFVPVSSDTTRSFLYRGGGALSLAPFDLRSATTVRIDTDTTTPVTLTSGPGGDWFPRPVPSRDGVYTWLHLPNHLAAAFPREVQVTGTWGWPAVPEAARRAAVTTVSSWLRRDLSQIAEADPRAIGPVAAATFGVPAAAKALLSPLKRPSAF